MPGWYVLFAAAEVCNSTPWELEQQPAYWRNHAVEYRNVNERIKERMDDKRNRAQTRRTGRGR